MITPVSVRRRWSAAELDALTCGDCPRIFEDNYMRVCFVSTAPKLSTTDPFHYKMIHPLWCIIFLIEMRNSAFQ
jgi:hypothetical protein